jgi:uncharacterized protein
VRRARHWLRRRLRSGTHKARQSAHDWLQRHPRVRGLLARSGSLDVDEYTLARGVAVGLFIGLTPTLGVQTPLMLGASMLFRANFPAAFIASWINNPFTVAFLYVGFHELGERVMALLSMDFAGVFGPRDGLEEQLAENTAALFVGSLCIATPAAVIGYFLFLQIWRRFDLHLPRHAVEAPDRD